MKNFVLLFALLCIFESCSSTKPGCRTLCPAHRFAKCSTQTDFVCAFYNKGHCPNEFCSKTLPNPCYACRDTNVKSYTSGICPQDEDKTFCDLENIPRPCPNPPAWLYQPACAYLRDCQEEPCRFTARYICPICGSQGVDYYTEGECKTYCKSKTIQEFCAQDSGPVCAYPKGCTDNSCRSTLSSSCVACGDSNIEYYTDGECYQPPSFDELA